MKFGGRFIIAIVVIILLIVLRYSKFASALNLVQIKEHRDHLQWMIKHHYIYSVCVYILFYTLAVSLSFPIASLLTLAGGYFFGAIMGALYTNIGATVGAGLAFLFFRYLVGAAVQKKYSKQLKRFNNALEKNEISYLLVIHLIAVVPFFLINILAAFTKVSLWTFVWTTAISIIPGSLVYSYAGRQLATIESVSDVIKPGIMLAFFLLALSAFLPVIIKKYERLNKARGHA